MSPSGNNPTVAGDGCLCEDACDGRKTCSQCGRNSKKTSLTSSSSSYALLSFDSFPVEDYDKRWRIFTASVKGFAIGAGIRGGLSLFAILARLRRRRSLSSVKTARWRALLAGAVAGPSMLLTGFNTQHTSLAVYIFMRAAVLASRCGIKSKRFGRICKPLTWAHGDLFLMCLSSTQILCAYILKQDSLPPTYKSFLNKHGGKDPIILQGIRDIACGVPFTNLEQIQKYYKSTGVDVMLDPQMEVPCSIIHENQSCSWHAFSFFLQSYKRAIPVYLPVYLIPALIVHRQGLAKRPFTILAKGLLGTARSSLFLSTYCTSAWVWTCFLFRLFKRCNVTMLALGTFPTGLGLAIEKKSRRIEISLYCLARAIESFFTTMSDIGYIPQFNNLKRVDVLIFSISTAIIMHCYAMERDVFRSKYLNVLDWVFGVPLPLYETTPKRIKNQTSL
ncbi:uncharacterized protein LOC112504491 isoform X2 [Cynara cardunculus var. scolymus]|uniref:uncharacterized protein LOC112504491 isoform X2 n=1 Tax=Cynara cardunculus var. scolymus TaxID=59895 RepID=UPI000D62D51E|nr:uncharacterized protein LOC112504491 isoform X2 [Cynara cardunculus var. scolymus]